MKIQFFIKIIVFQFVLLSLFFNSLVYAEGGSRRGSRSRHDRNDDRGAEKIPRNILKGVCGVLPGPSNPVPSNCGSAVIVLTDLEGKEVTKTRTGQGGSFEFTVEPGKGYKLFPGSQLYEIVEPTEEIRGGEKVVLKLKLK